MNFFSEGFIEHIINPKNFFTFKQWVRKISPFPEVKFKTFKIHSVKKGKLSFEEIFGLAKEEKVIRETLCFYKDSEKIHPFVEGVKQQFKSEGYFVLLEEVGNSEYLTDSELEEEFTKMLNKFEELNGSCGFVYSPEHPFGIYTCILKNAVKNE